MSPTQSSRVGPVLCFPLGCYAVFWLNLTLLGNGPYSINDHLPVIAVDILRFANDNWFGFMLIFGAILAATAVLFSRSRQLASLVDSIVIGLNVGIPVTLLLVIVVLLPISWTDYLIEELVFGMPAGALLGFLAGMWLHVWKSSKVPIGD